MHNRRTMIASLVALIGESVVAAPFPPPRAPHLPPVRKPQRLRSGDTIGLIAPASIMADAFDIQLVEEAVRALGLIPKMGRNLLVRNGYFAGDDKARAAELNGMFADKSVSAIMAVRGGWGSARLLSMLDYDMIRANPKLLIGYSDITTLHMAIAARCDFVTLHGPNGSSAWGKSSVESFKAVAMNGEMPLYQNPVATEDRLTQSLWRTRPIRAGKAIGRLMGGNLTVLTALVGTPYLPRFDGAILFLEDIDEAEYRIDRMLTQLGQAGILSRLSGVVFGQCTNCVAKDNGVGGFTLTDVLNQHILPLGIPAFQGSFIGHMSNQFSIPIGVKAEMDAALGTVRLLEPAVT